MLVTRNPILVPALLLLTGGCQREAAAPAVETAVDAAPAESALAVKHGTVTLTADSRAFQPCGEQQSSWLSDQSEENLEEIYSRLAGEPGTPLYVEVRGERNAAGAPPGYPGTFVLEEVLHAGVPGEGSGCMAAVPAYRLLARGNEPFWAVEVHADRMIVRLPDATAPLELPVEESLDTEGSVTYRGATDGHALELNVTKAACSDSMSGEFFAYTAAVRLDGRELQGCVRLRE